jgi:hypothetical protein
MISLGKKKAHFYRISISEKNKIQPFLDSFPTLSDEEHSSSYWEHDLKLAISQNSEYYQLSYSQEIRLGTPFVNIDRTQQFLFKFEEGNEAIGIEIVILTKWYWLYLLSSTLSCFFFVQLFDPNFSFLIPIPLIILLVRRFMAQSLIESIFKKHFLSFEKMAKRNQFKVADSL